MFHSTCKTLCHIMVQAFLKCLRTLRTSSRRYANGDFSHQSLSVQGSLLLLLLLRLVTPFEFQFIRFIAEQT